MERDKVLGPTGNPRQIANTELVRGGKRGGKHDPSGIRERLGLTGNPLRRLDVKNLGTQDLSLLEIQTQELTPVHGHTDSLTTVALR